MAVQRPVPQGRTEVLSLWGWSDELRSWTWPGHEGRALKVRVYTAGDEVRLFVNGKQAGIQPVPVEAGMKAEFEAPYEAGELKAVALSGGKQIAELVLKTAGPPASLRLRADRLRISASRNDLAYVTAEIVDKDGSLVPDAVVPVRISVTGAAELAAAGTANPKDPLSFRRPHLNTYHGKCLAIVRPSGGTGEAVVRAEADGLVSATVAVLVE
jgi:beta-galactosidase